jgi:hypothetical protein
VDPEDLALYYDGEWHHVFIVWNVGLTPPLIKMYIDNNLMATTRTIYTGNSGALIFSGQHKYAGPITWGVGVDLVDESLPFRGCLDKLMLYVSDTDNTDKTSEVHCHSIAVYHTAKPHAESAEVQMIPNGYYTFCGTTPVAPNQSLSTPTQPQLSLSGDSHSFPINWGNLVPNPFGLSTVFDMTGKLTDCDPGIL